MFKRASENKNSLLNKETSAGAFSWIKTDLSKQRYIKYIRGFR